MHAIAQASEPPTKGTHICIKLTQGEQLHKSCSCFVLFRERNRYNIGHLCTSSYNYFIFLFCYLVTGMQAISRVSSSRACTQHSCRLHSFSSVPRLHTIKSVPENSQPELESEAKSSHLRSTVRPPVPQKEVVQEAGSDSSQVGRELMPWLACRSRPVLA